MEYVEVTLKVPVVWLDNWIDLRPWIAHAIGLRDGELVTLGEGSVDLLEWKDGLAPMERDEE